MNNIYLVQPNFGTGSGNFASRWLPYSIGSLWAYARQFADISANYRLSELLFRREPIETVLNRMQRPAVVGFSTYIWNANYNLALAAAVKRRWPDTVVIFGGPEVPDDASDYLRENPFVDLTAHQEGELTFVALLRELLGEAPDFDRVPSVTFMTRDGVIRKTPLAGRITDLEILPSPYLTGVFDDIVEANPGTKWAATYETNRGCPFKCHFCDWGSVIFSKVKQFPEDRVRAELDWLADTGVEYVFVADANFGIFKQRDNAIADHILDAVARTGYPKTFCIQWAKNSNDDVVRIAKKLSSVQKGLTLSVQSMTEEVLEAVERRNMAINNLQEILATCNRENLPSYTELILGLPEETLDTWKSCFHKLLDLGQHCAIDIWIAQVLRNSALNEPEEYKRYKIETVSAKDYLTGATDDADADDVPISEEIRLIKSTASLPFDDFIEAYMYGWLILNFHLYGWTQLSARFLNDHSDVSYKRFYDALFDYVKSGEAPILAREYLNTRERIIRYMNDGEISGNLKDEIGLDLEISGHNLMWLSQMCFRSAGAAVFEELRPFLESIAVQLSPNLLEDMVLAQNHAIVFYEKAYPARFSINSNLVDAVFNEEPLSVDEPHQYVVDYRTEIREIRPDVDTMNMTDFLYMLYYKRRQSPGTTDMTAIEPNAVHKRPVGERFANAE